MAKLARALVLVAPLAAGTSCAQSDEFDCPRSSGPIPEHLCEWDLFEGDGSSQTPRAGVIPYTVISNLFTDDALKHRFIALPEGGKIGYDEHERWTFPVGTVLVKSFSFPRDARDPSLGEVLIETRLLVKQDSGAWKPLVYRWNEDQTDATRLIPGGRVPVEWIDEQGSTRAHEYRIPGDEDCKPCHGGKQEPDVLGLRTRQLALAVDHGEGPVDQIDWLAAQGLFDRAPEPAAERDRLVDPFGDADLVARARSYLDGNCAHCHRLEGDAQSSGLWLNWENQDELHLGVCKIPVAVGAGGGGLDFDIVPGYPDESIMIFRMEHTEPDIKMPELGGLLPDERGTALIREWIAAMEPKGCTQSDSP